MGRVVSEPIGSYALLSDCQGAALVSRGGSIDWACLPRFDSPSTFGALIGDGAGHWRIAPSGETAEVRVERAYLPDTLVLRTVFTTPSGRAQVMDALAFGPGERGHGIGKHSPHVLLRVIEGLDGEVPVEVDLAPRPEYGLIVPQVVPYPGGLRTLGGAQSLVLSTSLPLTRRAGSAAGTVPVTAGERVAFALEAASPWAPPPTLSDAEIDELMASTITGWRSWSGLHQSYDGPYAELVNHSGRVLQALTYAPTGAIVAAPTTSLPEEPGGARNWDYRYAWVRDTSLTLHALWVAACPDEAVDFFEFFATAAGCAPAGGDVDLQVLYGIGGEHGIAERALDHLTGYRDSRPVRVGNDAWDQLQLDVYGELLAAAAMLADQFGEIDERLAGFLVAVADTAAARWREPDRGIWEVRGEPRHFLFSKLMCWVALDRAIGLAPKLGAGHHADRWAKVRDEVRDAILTEGWSDRAGAYAQAFGSDDLDASALMLAVFGFLPATDARMAATIDAIATRLTDQHGFVYRYRSDDGLEGGEGTFAICTCWLVRCLAVAGRTAEARELFERLAAYGNDVGLFAEEIDPSSGELLGNFPQALTHVGLVNAAWAIAQAEAGMHRPAP
jgi:GH15 family glucan-1,4-alpha-glucosidase